ncbi:BppU family phage baseplate upper protein [Enterococcus faecium]|uniref:BppU family phage baseplate upper protein n=1 Tax=Enterococcus faecium TaxID=1352 RepID=UPI001F5136DE|nr:BppU family phage baseplate upper protein [Enterococcus faecium]
MAFKINESIIVIQAEAINPIQTNVVFWSHDRGTAKLRMKLVRKNGVPQSLPEGTTVPIRLIFRSATAEGGYGKHDYLATIEDRVNGIVSIVLEDNILGYVGKVEGSVYIDFPDDRSLDTAGRFTFDIKRSSIDDSTPELKDYYFNGFSQTIDKIEKILADGKQEIDQKITESETQIDAKVKDTNDKITKANQDVATLDQNLTELRNDMKLSEAWAWSKDGTDRFTTVYPTENILLNTSKVTTLAHWQDTVTLSKHPFYKNGTENIFRIDNPNTTENYAYTDWYPASSGEWTFSFKGFQNSALSNIDAYVFWRKEDTSQTGFIRLSGFDNFTINGLTTKESLLTLPEGTKDVYIRIDNNGSNTAGTTAELWFIEPVLRKGNMIGVPYTPAPSEDPINAYPQYRGVALLPSDLPDDYSWDIKPEYIEKGLNNTVSLTEPQSVEGLKNFEDGIQIAGDKVISENDCTVYTLTKDNSQSFIDGYATFIKHGKEVIVNGTVKFKKAYAFGVPLDDEVPDEFIARIVHGMLTGQSGTNSVSKAMYVQKDLGTIMTNSEFAANEWFTFHGNYWVGGK